MKVVNAKKTTLVLATIFFIVFATQAVSAKLEPAAVITLSFTQNAATPAGAAALALDEFKAGLAELPQYAPPARKEFEVRVLSAGGATLRSFWLSDPRYSYFDVVSENGTLSGGVKFNANARFFFFVPLLGEAKYAAVFDAAGNKLIAIDLRTGLQVEEKEWKEVALKIKEEEGWKWGAAEIAAVAVAALLAALIILGLIVFRKTSARKKK